MAKNLGCSPSAFEIYSDRTFRLLTTVFAWMAVLLIAAIVLKIGATAWPAVRKYGAGFVVGVDWEPTRERFGIGTQIAGTLYSATMSLSVPRPRHRPSVAPHLRRSLRSGGSLFDAAMTVLVLALSAVAFAPLVSLVGMVIVRGGMNFRPSLLWELPPAAGVVGGGIGNALVGTVLMVSGRPGDRHPLRRACGRLRG